MKSRFLAIIGILSLLAGIMVLAVSAQVFVVEMEPGDNLTVTCNGEFIETAYQTDPGFWDVECVESSNTVGSPTPTDIPPTSTPVPPTSTATSVPPTSTPVPPTATPTSFFEGWHGPQAHDGLNVHEHGSQPPAWVMNSPWPVTFPSGPELHQGFKFVCASMANGVRSCLLVHILATGADTDGDGFSDAGARSVPTHSFKLWIQEPNNGPISFWDDRFNFGGNGNPAPLRTSDTGERPIILSVGDGDCETWYSEPNGIDLGWTVCGRLTKFDGTPTSGDGTFRTADWIVIANELPFTNPVQLSPTLDNFCQVQFGVCRFTFLSNSVDFGSAEALN